MHAGFMQAAAGGPGPGTAAGMDRLCPLHAPRLHSYRCAHAARARSSCDPVFPCACACACFWDCNFRHCVQHLILAALLQPHGITQDTWVA